jgi:hypothetical protein
MNEKEARSKLENALMEYVRITRPDVGNVFVQDYVIACASESMDPGQENVTYFNHLNRAGMPTYGVVGLLDSAVTFYRKEGQPDG